VTGLLPLELKTKLVPTPSEFVVFHDGHVGTPDTIRLRFRSARFSLDLSLSLSQKKDLESKREKAKERKQKRGSKREKEREKKRKEIRRREETLTSMVVWI
jgi:hypothetical protein